MHKNPLPLPEKDGARPHRIAMAGHARQFQDPRAHANKANPCRRPRTVLVAEVSENTDGVGAACVEQLAEAGHRVVTMLCDESMLHGLADALATGRVFRLPGKAMDRAGIRSAVRSLPPPFRSLDAVVNIMHLPPCRIALFGADAQLTEMNPSAHARKLLDTVRAALPSLLASERGHVVEVRLAAQADNATTGYSPADALCAALRSELDDMGIRFTRINAGPMECQASVNARAGNRPKFHGVQHGALAATDVAQAIAWTLAQPDHIAVRDIAVSAAPRAQPALSPREREVLEWTACGKTSEEISCILELSVSAVNFHVKNLLCKLDCCNKTAAVARAALLGMLA